MVSNKSSGRGAWLKPAYFSFTPEICQSLTPVYELPNIPVCGVQDLHVSSGIKNNPQLLREGCEQNVAGSSYRKGAQKPL